VVAQSNSSRQKDAEKNKFGRIDWESLKKVFFFQVPTVWEDGLGVVEEVYFSILKKTRIGKRLGYSWRCKDNMYVHEVS
jgi:hypothetical protein